MATKTAVLCDDDRTLVHIMQFVLAKKGFSVRTAENGVVAMSLLAAEKPGLLFLDLEMPEKDGFTVLKELQDAGPHKIYVIVLSSHERKETHDRATSLGANEVWVKPFNAGELLKRIEGLIEQGKV